MPLLLDTKKLEKLMKAFYTLTHIKIVIIDAQYQELLAYPPRHSPFCALMHENPATCAHCQQSSIHLCQKSRRQGGLIVDRCHAGLTEAVAPLRDAANMIIGYIMFGQITILSSYEELLARILESCTGYSLPPDLLAEKASHITHVTPEQIVAAGEILNACTDSILLQQMVSLKEKHEIHEILRYIDSHLHEPLTISFLCDQFHISRTTLYDMTKPYMKDGIAAYIKMRRLEKAKDLLQYGTDPVSSISQQVGFPDYNYFHRVFKQYAGVSAKQYRKLRQ